MTESVHFPASVFKAYDIRGTLPDQLNAPFARHLGRALAQQARQADVNTVVVGYDGRLSSPDLARTLHDGLNEGGVDSVDLGCVPTPLVYYAAHVLKTGSGIAITGSHNPPDYNGFKIMLAGKTLYGEDIQALRRIMLHPDPLDGLAPGNRHSQDMLEHYVARIVDDVRLARPMRIAIDCGNGAGGVVAEHLFTRLGCEVYPLYCDVDGTFPNHHPDPAVPANLADLISHVAAHQCDLGLAFDGDADRLGVVTQEGNIIWPDRQLILYAQDVLSRQPGATIVFDVKCSRHVERAITGAGGKAVMGQTGHSLIKARMIELDAALGGEMSGHTFFAERWYGFDDGLYTGARLLEILSHYPDPSAILNALPQDIATPELQLRLAEGEPAALIRRLQEHGEFPTAQRLITLDGVRAEYADGFGLARASNTTPVIVLRFEAETAEGLARIQDEYRQAFRHLAPDRTLPF